MKQLNELNQQLFAALEKLNQSKLTGDALKEEIDRAQAVGSLACQIVNSCALQLKAQAMAASVPQIQNKHSAELIVPIEDLDKPRVMRDKNFYKSVK